ncbi:MAG: hypothetical protein ACYDEO_24730, partial [Aggregatilineales bacterium]
PLARSPTLESGKIAFGSPFLDLRRGLEVRDTCQYFGQYWQIRDSLSPRKKPVATAKTLKDGQKSAGGSTRGLLFIRYNNVRSSVCGLEIIVGKKRLRSAYHLRGAAPIRMMLFSSSSFFGYLRKVLWIGTILPNSLAH